MRDAGSTRRRVTLPTLAEFVACRRDQTTATGPSGQRGAVRLFLGDTGTSDPASATADPHPPENGLSPRNLGPVERMPTRAPRASCHTHTAPSPLDSAQRREKAATGEVTQDLG